MPTTFKVEVAVQNGGASPYVAVNRRTVFLAASEYGATGYITVPDSIDPDGKFLLSHSFIGPVGAQSRVRISAMGGGTMTTPWVTINQATHPYGASYRRFLV